jgi:septin family protein
MWKVKANVIPVIRRANGTILKSFRKYLRNIMGRHTIKEMQKTATFG